MINVSRSTGSHYNDYRSCDVHQIYAAPKCDMFNLGLSYFHVPLTTVRHLLNVSTYYLPFLFKWTSSLDLRKGKPLQGYPLCEVPQHFNNSLQHTYTCSAHVVITDISAIAQGAVIFRINNPQNQHSDDNTDPRQSTKHWPSCKNSFKRQDNNFHKIPIFSQFPNISM